MPGGSLRLFVGVPVPAGGHHVTLRFLGAVPEGDLGGLVARIAAACSDVGAASARLVGLGGFPQGRRARVLWAGVRDDGTLERLATALLGLPGDPPPGAFVAHCTLARFDPPALLGTPAEGSLGEGFPVDTVVLYRSRPGAAYEALEIFPLGR